MKLALISLSKDMPGNSEPVGLLPLFDGLLVDQQIQLVVDAGVDKIVLISPTMNNSVLQYVDELQRKKIDIEIVRSGHDLIQFATPENALIYLNDGILPSRETVRKLSSFDEEAIFVTPDSQQVAEFERIDRDDRWLGIAQLDASRLSEFIDMPEDWDVGSALLRGAVQSQCYRERIEETDLLDGAISVLTSETDTAKFSKLCLQNVNTKHGNILEKWLIWPIAKSVLPSFWQAPSVRDYLGWATPAAGIIAGGLVLFNLPITAAIALLAIGAFLLYIRRKYRIYSIHNNKMDAIAIGFNILSIAVVSIIIMQQSAAGSQLPNLVVFALAIGSILLIYKNEIVTKWTLIKPDIGMALITLLIFSLFGAFMLGLYVIALWGMGYLLVSQFDLKDY